MQFMLSINMWEKISKNGGMYSWIGDELTWKIKSGDKPFRISYNGEFTSMINVIVAY